MITVGLTGPTGAGKSSVVPIFIERGFVPVDCDRLARMVTMPDSEGFRALTAAFGGDLVKADGSLDRALLAERAFATPEGRERINSITHPIILGLVRAEVKAAHDGGRSAIIDAPLLFESGLERDCDATVAVLASAATRIGRISARDGLTREAAMLRISAQQPCAYYAARANYSVTNEDGGELLARRAARIADDIIARYDS